MQSEPPNEPMANELTNVFADKVKHHKPDQPFYQEEQEAYQPYPFKP
ncbi:MAG: hypothetical protein J7577_13910 [Sphingobacteriaceae bacterium]|nr:hypothetical protein [Sphingobacteriaceae bacterium]